MSWDPIRPGQLRRDCGRTSVFRGCLYVILGPRAGRLRPARHETWAVMLASHGDACVLEWDAQLVLEDELIAGPGARP